MEQPWLIGWSYSPVHDGCVNTSTNHRVIYKGSDMFHVKINCEDMGSPQTCLVIFNHPKQNQLLSTPTKTHGIESHTPWYPQSILAIVERTATG